MVEIVGWLIWRGNGVRNCGMVMVDRLGMDISRGVIYLLTPRASFLPVINVRPIEIFARGNGCKSIPLVRAMRMHTMVRMSMVASGSALITGLGTGATPDVKVSSGCRWDRRRMR
jgi:hypothetical protein